MKKIGGCEGGGLPPDIVPPSTHETFMTRVSTRSEVKVLQWMV